MWNRLIISLITISLLTSCSTIYSLTEDETPILISNKYEHYTSELKTLKIVSYNIEKGHNVKKIISTINKNDKIENPDLLLLQEVCGDSIHTISENLSMNFVFYPSSEDINTKNQFGNAILSKYKIDSSKKLLLPHVKPNGRRKIATIASITINDKSLSVVSVHLETMVMKLSKRRDQLLEIVNYFGTEDKNVIIGGDFNSFFDKDKKVFNDIMKDYSYLDLTQNIGGTGSAIVGLINPRLDYIYGRGLPVLDAGRGPKNSASDHRAIWCLLEL